MRKVMRGALCVLVMLSLVLSSCQKDNSAEHRTLPPAELAVGWLSQPREMAIRVPLYFYRTELDLEIEYREVVLSPGQTRAQIAIEELFRGASEPGFDVPFVAREVGVYPKSVIVSGKTAIVDLEPSTGGSIDLSARIKARVPIANTLIDLLGVEYVDIFYNGRAMTYYEYSLGAMRRYDGSPQEYYEQIDQLYKSDSWYPREIDITLYFPDAEGRYLYCETRPIEIRSESDAQYEIMRELLKGPTDARLQNVVTGTDMPEIISNINYSEPSQSNGEDTGRIPYQNVLDVAFSTRATSTLSQSAVIASLMSLSLSGVEAISVTFDGQNDLDTPQTYVTRAEISDPIAQSVVGRRIADGHLEGAEVLLPQYSYEDPTALLRALFAEVDYGVPPEAIRTAFVSRDCAVVDFDAAYASSWQNWGEETKRLFLYAIVNTLTELSGVRRVQFLEDGQLMTSMAPLSLGSPLLRNPGLEIEEML